MKLYLKYMHKIELYSLKKNNCKYFIKKLFFINKLKKSNEFFNIRLREKS